jgi:hypothetical protein
MQRSLSMRRLAIVTVAVFLLVLVFLAGHVRAGTDPAQVKAPASSTAAPQYGAAGDIGPSGDPYGGSAGAPGDGLPVPGDGAGSGGGAPMTHAS